MWQDRQIKSSSVLIGKSIQSSQKDLVHREQSCRFPPSLQELHHFFGLQSVSLFEYFWQTHCARFNTPSSAEYYARFLILCLYQIKFNTSQWSRRILRRISLLLGGLWGLLPRANSQRYGRSWCSWWLLCSLTSSRPSIRVSRYVKETGTYLHTYIIAFVRVQ